MGDDADKAPYLGIAGGYTIGSTNLEAKEFLTTVYWDDKYDATKITEQFNKCLQGEIKEKEDEQALTPKQ